MNNKFKLFSWVKLQLRVVIQVIMMASFLSVSVLAMAQSNVKLRGRVTSGVDQNPLIGVSVSQAGSSNGTATDLDGNYELTVPAGVVLQFTYLGYTSQQVTVVAGKTVYDVVLQEDTRALDEVVVVGYGIQKKSVVTAAISQVSGADLSKGSPVNFQNALKGKVSGALIVSESGAPGAGARVLIRGVGTINNTSPLYIVDGMPMDAINNINPSDIQSVEVLKDAASAAIYGTRGANGVVLITTKSGIVAPPKLTYETSFGWQNPTKTLDYMDATEYQLMINEMRMNGGNQPIYSSAPKYNTNWQEELLNRNAPVVNHRLSLNGGSDRNLYFLSFGYLDQQGLVASEDSYYKRYNARFNNTYKLTEDYSRLLFPKVTIETRVNYSHTESNSIGNNSDVSGILTSMALTPPNEPVYQTDEATIAQYKILYPNYVTDKNGQVFNIINMRELGNPLALREISNNNINKANDFAGNVTLNAEILKGLTFRSSGSFAWGYWGSRGFVKPYYISTATVSTQSRVYDSKNESYTWQAENTLTYDKLFGAHHITALLGQSALASVSTGISGEDYGLLRYGLDYAYINSATADRTQERVSGGISEHFLASFFGRLAYNYNEKYMLSLVLRRDGSSNFGPNNKYGYFPSVSAGWNLMNESFMQKLDLDWLNTVKLRASWGRNGNESVGAFGYSSDVATGGTNVALGISDNEKIMTGAVNTRYANPSIKWETSEQTDIGVDFRFNNAISFSFDWFDKKTKDMLLYLETPKYLGYWGMDANVGTMSNHGYEFELIYDFKISDVHFKANANASYIQNEVTDKGSGISSIAQLGAGLANADVAIVQSGYPYGYFRGYTHDGIFQNWDEVNAHVGPSGKLLQPNAQPGDIRFANLNGDDLIDDKDLKMIGNPIPDWIFGFTLNADWKNFDFTAFFQGVAGNQIYNYDRRPNLPYANWHRKWLNRWTGEGTSDWWPRVVEDDAANQNTARVSQLYIENGNYLRLKLLQLGYTLPVSITKKAGISTLRVFAQGDNLLTFTKYRGYDPEVGARSGMDSGTYPQAKVFTVGASVTF
ncbi:MAG: TonB-dependent receptor [Dysgonamonadaceae bacterium]|jgi:TonB-linked SusC/RagA family outer membrane protein|nr:TonB-dependent receptor [Dysgonamonadaceae bacterium]